MNFYQKLDFNAWQSNMAILNLKKEIDIDLNDKNVNIRLNSIKQEFINDAFEKGNFNFEVYKEALNAIMEKKK